MDTIRDVLTSNLKHREKVALLTGKSFQGVGVLAGLIDLLKTGTDVERGTAAEVMKFVSKSRPELLLPYVDVLIEYIDYSAPRVRWGCPEALGNMAQSYPEAVEKAIPKLIANLDDKSTVVRWCAAYALTQIALYHRQQQDTLVKRFHSLAKTEKNNGVKNLYVKTLKLIKKSTQ